MSEKLDTYDQKLNRNITNFYINKISKLPIGISVGSNIFY